MTASDARPPSDTEATGWHMPKGETADDLRWYATHEALSRHSIFDVLQHVADLMETRTLVDPAEARQKVAEALFSMGFEAPWIYADAVFAALAGREQP